MNGDCDRRPYFPFIIFHSPFIICGSGFPGWSSSYFHLFLHHCVVPPIRAIGHSKKRS